jgi:hypothetical protein
VPGPDQPIPPFLDPTGDGFLSPQDVLVVINALNVQAASAGSGEGESGLAAVPDRRPHSAILPGGFYERQSPDPTPMARQRAEIVPPPASRSDPGMQPSQFNAAANSHRRDHRETDGIEDFGLSGGLPLPDGGDLETAIEQIARAVQDVWESGNS